MSRFNIDEMINEIAVAYNNAINGKPYIQGLPIKKDDRIASKDKKINLQKPNKKKTEKSCGK